MNDTNGGIVAFKTSTGEEVISKYQKNPVDEENVYELVTPMAIKVFQTQKGEFGMGLVPWFYSSQTIKFNFKDALVYSFDLDQDLVNNYLAEVSPIELVQNQRKILV